MCGGRACSAVGVRESTKAHERKGKNNAADTVPWSNREVHTSILALCIIPPHLSLYSTY